MAKRIADVDENTPVADAARRVLAHRLEAVRDRIGDTLADADDRRRHIHALRVATRRAAAAADLFAACLPRKVHRQLRDHLRRLRRTVGRARDWDVVLSQLGRRLEGALPSDVPAIDMLSGYALARRVPAQRQLEEATSDYPFGFDRLMARTLVAVRGPERTTFGAIVRPLVSRMLSEFQDLCGRGDGEWAHLHEVRIAGKRLRYALELVQPCFGGLVSDDVGPALAKLQETLGAVNDSFNATLLLKEIHGGLADCLPGAADRYRSLIERQLAEHETTMRTGRDLYRAWLVQWRSQGLEHALIAFRVAPDAGPAPATPTQRASSG
jgi:hypothetical protein